MPQPPTVYSFVLRHAALGFGVGVLLAAGLVASDVAGLRHLVLDSDNGWIGALVLAFSMGLTFGGFQSGAAVMRLGQDDTRPRGGRRSGVRIAPSGGAMMPVPARVRARR